MNEAQPITIEDVPVLQPELPTPAPGELLAGRYRILRLVARGGMGAVYEAEHVDLGRRCAIKFLRTELACRPRSYARFQREARLIGGMSHDNITQVVDFGRYREQYPYLVMEYLNGRTLRHLLEEALPGIEACVEIMQQVCRGAAYSHEHGVVHRDLKPENLMLTQASDGSLRIKVMDFGIARSFSIDTRLTPTGVELGTAHYMSPEQARGARNIGPTSDVYSLGVIFYELICGKRPHPGQTYNEVIFHLLTQAPVRLTARAPSCPREICAVVDRCLALRPEERYASAKELLEAVEALGTEGKRATSMSTQASAAVFIPPRRPWPRFALGLFAGTLLTGGLCVLLTEKLDAVTSPRLDAAALMPLHQTGTSARSPSQSPTVIAGSPSEPRSHPGSLESGAAAPDPPAISNTLPAVFSSSATSTTLPLRPPQPARAKPAAAASKHSLDSVDTTPGVQPRAAGAPARAGASDAASGFVVRNPYD